MIIKRKGYCYTAEWDKKHIIAAILFTTSASLLSQEMNNISSATEYYRDVLKRDNTHVEAIACIGSNHFYTDQPEIALRFYRSDELPCIILVAHSMHL